MQIKQIFILFFIIICNLAYAQKGKAILILKDSTKIVGTGEISGISNTGAAIFYNDTLKFKTYKSKEIIGIDILENNYFRRFRYKRTDKYGKKKRFPELLEVVLIDSLSLYVRIYDPGALSSLSGHSVVTEDTPNITIEDYVDEIEKDVDILKFHNTINVYGEINFPRYSYYVGKGNGEAVDHLYTKGLPFAKKFKNSMKSYFKDCPELIEKVENKDFKSNAIREIIEFYNHNCFQK